MAKPVEVREPQISTVAVGNGFQGAITLTVDESELLNRVVPLEQIRETVFLKTIKAVFQRATTTHEETFEKVARAHIAERHDSKKHGLRVHLDEV